MTTGFRFINDELAEVGGRSHKHSAAEVGEPRLQFWVGQGRVDLPC